MVTFIHTRFDAAEARLSDVYRESVRKYGEEVAVQRDLAALQVYEGYTAAEAEEVYPYYRLIYGGSRGS